MMLNKEKSHRVKEFAGAYTVSIKFLYTFGDFLIINNLLCSVWCFCFNRCFSLLILLFF